jgi:hypothetical protein
VTIRVELIVETKAVALLGVDRLHEIAELARKTARPEELQVARPALR